jgi:hypothetical protein
MITYLALVALNFSAARPDVGHGTAELWDMALSAGMGNCVAAAAHGSLPSLFIKTGETVTLFGEVCFSKLDIARGGTLEIGPNPDEPDPGEPYVLRIFVDGDAVINGTIRGNGQGYFGGFAPPAPSGRFGGLGGCLGDGDINEGEPGADGFDAPAAPEGRGPRPGAGGRGHGGMPGFGSSTRPGGQPGAGAEQECPGGDGLAVHAIDGTSLTDSCSQLAVMVFDGGVWHRECHTQIVNWLGASAPGSGGGGGGPGGSGGSGAGGPAWWINGKAYCGGHGARSGAGGDGGNGGAGGAGLAILADKIELGPTATIEVRGIAGRPPTNGEDPGSPTFGSCPNAPAETLGYAAGKGGDGSEGGAGAGGSVVFFSLNLELSDGAAIDARGGRTSANNLRGAAVRHHGQVIFAIPPGHPISLRLTPDDEHGPLVKAGTVAIATLKNPVDHSLQGTYLPPATGYVALFNYDRVIAVNHQIELAIRFPRLSTSLTIGSLYNGAKVNDGTSYHYDAGDATSEAAAIAALEGPVDQPQLTPSSPQVSTTPSTTTPTTTPTITPTKPTAIGKMGPPINASSTLPNAPLTDEEPSSADEPQRPNNTTGQTVASPPKDLDTTSDEQQGYMAAFTGYFFPSAVPVYGQHLALTANEKLLLDLIADHIDNAITARGSKANVKVIVQGSTDALGNRADNELLGQRRADAIAAELGLRLKIMQKGEAAIDIRATSVGEDCVETGVGPDHARRAVILITYRNAPDKRCVKLATFTHAGKP